MGLLPGHWMLAMSTHSRESPPFWMVCYGLPRTVTGCWKAKQGRSAKLRVLSHNNSRVAQDSTVPVEPPTVPSVPGLHLPSQGLLCAFWNREWPPQGDGEWGSSSQDAQEAGTLQMAPHMSQASGGDRRVQVPLTEAGAARPAACMGRVSGWPWPSAAAGL